MNLHYLWYNVQHCFNRNKHVGACKQVAKFFQDKYMYDGETYIHTVSPIFFARVVSAMFANGLSAPQHSTYFVILLDGLDRHGAPPGVAKPNPKSLTKLLCLSEVVLGRKLPFSTPVNFYKETRTKYSCTFKKRRT